MYQMSPRRKYATRQMRRNLLLQLIAVASISGGSVMAGKEQGNILVTAAVQDCCPPTVVDPCCPAETSQPIYMEAPQNNMVPSGEVINAAPSVDSSSTPAATPQPQFDATPQADPTPQFDSSNQFDTGANFDAPVTSNAAADSFAASPAATSLASNTGTGGGLDAPNMLGDSPGYGPVLTVLGVPYSTPNASGRRFKITENVSPIPQDRVFYSYNHFDDALQVNATDYTYLDRHLFGGEKTLLDGLFSVELRMVVTDGFDSFQDNATLDRAAEFGNLQFSFKSLLYSSCTCQVGGGVTLSVPTADDTVIDTVLAVENETVFLAPYIGFVSTPSKDTFFQGFLQTDFALGGDSVFDGAGVEQGVFNEQHLLYMSLSAGHWLYQDSCRNACVNGIAGLVELHYTSAMSDGDSVLVGANSIAASENLDILNATAGLVVSRGMTNLRIGGSVPLRDDEQLYDNEFQIQLNRRF